MAGRGWLVVGAVIATLLAGAAGWPDAAEASGRQVSDGACCTAGTRWTDGTRWTAGTRWVDGTKWRAGERGFDLAV